MSKKDYITIAKAIESFGYVNYLEKRLYVEALCNLFEHDNKRFNRKKFVEACGLIY